MPRQCAITLDVVDTKVDTIISSLGEQFTSVRNDISVIDVDNTTRFEATAVDNTSGPIASANITAGTITITRYRAGVATAIVTAAAMTKADGKVYYDYTFAAASWATDDSYIAVLSAFTFTINSITQYPSISPWYGNIANMSGIESKVDTVVTGLIRKESTRVFPSLNQVSAVLPAIAADVDFPSVTVPALPAGVTITSAYVLLLWRKQIDSSGATNAINGVDKTIRIKVSTGAWAADDIVCMTIPDNSLSTDGSATEGGDIIIGNVDVKAVVTGAGTYNFRSVQTTRLDALAVDGASLTLQDVKIAIVLAYQ